MEILPQLEDDGFELGDLILKDADNIIVLDEEGRYDAKKKSKK